MNLEPLGTPHAPAATRKPELLAPAGHVEGFHAALESGADAVYLGLKKLSARATAANFTLDELAVLVPYAHKRNVSIYVALNSLVTAQEFPGVVGLLQSLSDLQVDALIVQDQGLFFLAKKFFPRLRLHASTLMSIHNHAGVKQLGRMGATRVVLARELSVQEIEGIAAKTEVELEIFVHGALCFSYSGLCMASSFRGGHSGLQGRCVQPCRLQFRQGRKTGFFLSCNDLCALPMVPQLKKARISAFKIEGRMKPADYVARVVKAYRLMLDATPAGESDALSRAQETLSQSASRRLTLGFMGNKSDVLSPHRSGSSGLWVGNVKAVKEGQITVSLRHDLHSGDRLRPESTEGKEKSAFTVSEIYSRDGVLVNPGKGGDFVVLTATVPMRQGERLFRVGGKTENPGSIWQKIHRDTPNGLSYRRNFPRRGNIFEDWPSVTAPQQSDGERLMLKVAYPHDLLKAFQSSANLVLLTASRSNLERLSRQKLIPAQKQRLVWSLPPLITEKEVDYYRLAVRWYVEKGFRAWELNNWGHFDFFDQSVSLQLIAGYRFNLRNAAALAALAQEKCGAAVLSLEITREELQNLGRGPLSAVPIVTLYAWPPLFTSRLTLPLHEEKPFLTPRNEVYYHRSKSGLSLVFADRPMNWFANVAELRSLGFRNFLIDLSEGPQDLAKELDTLLMDFRRMRAKDTYSLFNLDRRP